MNRLMAADLNNLGAIRLQNGCLQTSLELFRDALALTLNDLEQHSSSCKDGERELENTFAERDHANRLTLATSCSDGENAYPWASSVPFIQSQAVRVIHLTTAYSSDPLVNMTIVSSIILFNLGIVYHLRGLEEGTSESSAHLIKACSLYQKSQVLLADSGVSSKSTGNPVIDMLTMANYNNLAQVFFELSMYDDSRQHFEQLIAFALTIEPSRYGDVTIAFLVDQQKSNFLLNAMILQAPKIAAAA